MSYRSVFDPAGFQEYESAVKWYLERSLNAADNFTKEMNEKIDAICSDPFRFQATYELFREASLKKYPYSIVFIVDDSRRIVIITSVYHHKRDPKRKYKK